MSNTEDQFYIKTTDGTVFCIYELTFDSKSSTMSFGYAPLESLSIDKEEYADEVEHIVRSSVSDFLAEIKED